VALWLEQCQAWPKTSLGPGKAGPKIALGVGYGQTKRHVALVQLHPRPEAQRHLTLALLPLACSLSATWSLSCLHF